MVSQIIFEFTIGGDLDGCPDDLSANLWLETPSKLASEAD